MKKLLLSALLFTTLGVSQSSFALVLLYWDFLNCTATDGKNIRLTDFNNDKLTLAYGEMNDPNNYIEVKPEDVIYRTYKKNGKRYYSVTATDGTKSYSIFQTDPKKPHFVAGIRITSGNKSQDIYCKTKQKAPDATYGLIDIFKIEYFQPYLNQTDSQ